MSHHARQPGNSPETVAEPNEPSTGSRRGERLQKVLAAAGLASRRQCEEVILEGRVEVDRKVITELGTRVDPQCQEIRVDGVPLPRCKLLYFLVNKPRGVLCTNRDPAGRTRVIDLIKTDQRLFTVGRLDRSSEGLLLVTNDGQLANQLTHPRYGVPKTYLVRVIGSPRPEDLDQLRQGVYLDEGLAHVSSLRIRRRQKQYTVLEMVLTEGRNREIRRLLARIGHKVVHLQRISIGPLRLGDLPPGAHRRLTPNEVQTLRRAAASTLRHSRRRKSRRRRQTDGSPRRSRRDVSATQLDHGSAEGRKIRGTAASGRRRGGRAPRGTRERR